MLSVLITLNIEQSYQCKFDEVEAALKKHIPDVSDIVYEPDSKKPIAISKSTRRTF